MDKARASLNKLSLCLCIWTLGDSFGELRTVEAAVVAVRGPVEAAESAVSGSAAVHSPEL